MTDAPLEGMLTVERLIEIISRIQSFCPLPTFSTPAQCDEKNPNQQCIQEYSEHGIEKTL